jgi:hypothetical protein
MDGYSVRWRVLALFVTCAIALQMFLPFAALAAAPMTGSASVICSSTAPSDNQAGHQACSCAAGCGICCAHMAAVLPDAAAMMLPRVFVASTQLLIGFQVAAVRFAPQAARPPPVG